MNSATILVLILAQLALGAEFYSEDDRQASKMLSLGMARAGISPRIMEAQLIQKLDDFLNNFPNFTAYNNLTLNILNETIRVTGFLKNTSVSGLDNHVIDRVKFSVFPISIALHLALPKINTNGYYDIDGLFGKIVPIYGKGHQDISVDNFSFFISIGITSVGGQLIIKTVDLEVGLDAVTLDLENLLGGDLGKVVCDIIQENASEYLKRILYWYGEEIDNTIIAVGNKVLDGKTIDDILGWLQGKTTTTSTDSPPTSAIPFY